MSKVAVSLVTFNHQSEELIQLVESLRESSLVEEVSIIDNSKDSLLSGLGDKTKINYIFNNNNLGYGKAHNIGIDISIKQGVDYHLVVNPDILIDANVIDELVSFMDNNLDVGLVMPKVIYPDGSLQFLCKKLPTPFDLIGRRFLPARIKGVFQMRLDSYELKHKDYNIQMDVPNLSGCFMFMRTDILAKIGGFDERFFMYLEDTDLCRRIGGVSRTVYYPKVTIIHSYAKDSYKSFKLLKYHIQSAFAYFNKWGWFFDSNRSKKNNSI